ncbi:FAD-binding domain-containing protein [Limnobacter sp.]|uniref:FAD-binding domain-containing protein n=1 Tax=Limnobacter sp. TaxID=2003368 RepID=UPI003511CEE1
MLTKTKPNGAAPDQGFEASREAALKAIQAVNPDLYARTRNYLDGAVTRLSPWITHGFTDTREVCSLIHQRKPLGFDDKIVFELAWREFFKHVHGELGKGILEDVRRPVWPGRYQVNMPDDILEGRTGVPAIDDGVRQLYETGYLHNHSRMWIASYVVHIRKVHWRIGADWMYSHLLDGDLASNHLSWQWVAGTFSHKPYVFNAENVNKFARHLDCKGTAIDTSYEDLEATARSRRDLGPEPKRPSVGMAPPENWVPNKDNLAALTGLPVCDLRDPDEAAKALGAWQGPSNVRLVHPWDLRAPSEYEHCVAVVDVAFHEAHPWNADRWRFVARGLAACKQLWMVDSRMCIQSSGLMERFKQAGLSFQMMETLNPGYVHLSRCMPLKWVQAPRILPNPSRFQQSFSRFYREAATAAKSLEEALS